MAERRFKPFKSSIILHQTSLLNLCYYTGKILFFLPLKRSVNDVHNQLGDDVSFRTSFSNRMSSFVLLMVCLMYLYRNYVTISLCHSYHNCRASWLASINNFYCLLVLFISVFLRPYKLAKLFNKMYNLRYELNIISVREFLRPLTLYFAILIHFLRVGIILKMSDLHLELLFEQLVFIIPLFIDCFIVSITVILESHFKYINKEISVVADRANAHKILYRLACSYLKMTMIVKCTSDVLGPYLLMLAAYKQLQVMGMIHFTILSEGSIRNKSGVQGILDALLPAFSFGWVCLNVSLLISQANYTKVMIRYLARLEHWLIGLKEKIELFSQIVYNQHMEFSACGFKSISVVFYVQVVMSAIQLIIAMEQFKPAKQGPAKL